MKSIFNTVILISALISASALADPAGTWDLLSPSPMGEMPEILILNADGTGSVEYQMGKAEFSGATIDGNSFEFTITVNSPMGEMQLQYSGGVDGDDISGNLGTPMGPQPFSGTRSD